MIPGPVIIIACPHCEQYMKKKTLISGNTFGSKLWSDGKRISPMLPEFPSLTLCKNCRQFFWVKDAKMIAKVINTRELNEKWLDIDFVEFPSFNEYFKALETISDEKFIRINLWHSFNDYSRKGRENEITADMVRMNNENLKVLLTLLNESDDNELIMKAEVLRNFGRFEESLQLLNKVKGSALAPIIERFLAEINYKNTQVFRLK